MWKTRSLCTKTSAAKIWSIKQVTKSNFSATLDDVKHHISDSDFVAVSLQNTGSSASSSSSSAWQRVLPFDTAETAYLKAKFAAERFLPIQFAICPFSVRASKLRAYPCNFHLFPRDELKMGMPSYSFSYQTSYLTSMAQEGFDFNACIYDGISYLSRSQESTAKDRMGNFNSMSVNHEINQSTNNSVVDTIFKERTKSRVKHWRTACSDSGKRDDNAFVISLRKLIIGSEEYNSRPCINIDVCSERQVQLILEMLREISDDLVPIKVPVKDGVTRAVRVVLTKSKEDKDCLEGELRDLEDEQNKKLRGFREVIDLISASQKPVVSYNSLNDFTFIHEKFIAPLPANMDDFIDSLRLSFSHIIDVNNLMKEVGQVKNANSLPAAVHNLKRRFFVPIDMEIPHLDDENEGKIHGNNVLRISQLFTKLCSILKIKPVTLESGDGHLDSNFKRYANIFTPCSTRPLEAANDGDISVWTNSTRKVSSENLVFLWGFRTRLSARVLKKQLQGSHSVFTEEFDIRLVDKSCAIIVFWQPGLSDRFLEVMNGKEICGSLREMVSEGVKAAGYKTYKRICKLGIWEAELAESLDKTFANPELFMGVDNNETKLSEIHGSSDSMVYMDDMIYFDDL